MRPHWILLNTAEILIINVVAKKIGSVSPDEWFLFGAHYDSITSNYSDRYVLAPGADDNGSGIAGVIELARILAETTPEVSIIFVGFAAEEQGYKGSAAYVQNLINTSEIQKLQVALIFDMITYMDTSVKDVLLEGRLGVSDEIRGRLTQAANDYTDLTVFGTNDYLGSDHVPFLDNDISGMLIIEEGYDNYPYYHTKLDNYDAIKDMLGFGVSILKMSLATAAGCYKIETKDSQTGEIPFSRIDLNGDKIIDYRDMFILEKNWFTQTETDFVSN